MMQRVCRESWGLSKIFGESHALIGPGMLQFEESTFAKHLFWKQVYGIMIIV